MAAVSVQRQPSLPQAIAQIPDVPDWATCPISQDVIVNPVKVVNCGTIPHIFDMVPLATWYERNTSCPNCRTPITHVIPDRELADRIQREFVNASEANKNYFNQVKNSQPRAPFNLISIAAFNPFPEQRLESAQRQRSQVRTDINRAQRSQSRRNHLGREERPALFDFSFVKRFLPSRQATVQTTIRSGKFLWNAVSTTAPKALRAIDLFNYITPPKGPKENYTVYLRVEKLAKNGSLPRALRHADFMTNNRLQDKAYERIIEAYLRTKNDPISHERALEILYKISNVNTKDTLLYRMSLEYLKKAKFPEAISLIRSISSGIMSLTLIIPFMFFLSVFLTASTIKNIFVGIKNGVKEEI
ncbi:MAG: hypothetical protein JXA94_01115 [Parachlamydiales bacterium]|nr:hypothetical protein [Parachlamydiales bacterium]